MRHITYFNFLFQYIRDFLSIFRAPQNTLNTLVIPICFPFGDFLEFQRIRSKLNRKLQNFNCCHR